MAHPTVQVATLEEVAEIASLVRESARTLSLSHYSPAQIEGALKAAWGVDTQLIVDKTYLIALVDGVMAACGGWSYRATLFGSDAESSRSADTIDPVDGAARIRAFFVRPAFARRGIGSLLLERCAREALLMGYHRLELVATLPGQPFYASHGFVVRDLIRYPLGGQLEIDFVRMEKRILDSSNRPKVKKKGAKKNANSRLAEAQQRR